MIFKKILYWFTTSHHSEESEQIAMNFIHSFLFDQLVKSGNEEAIELSLASIKSVGNSGISIIAEDFIRDRTRILVNKFGKKKLDNFTNKTANLIQDFCDEIVEIANASTKN